MTGGPSRKRTGDRAEQAVVDWLVAQDFRILATNLRLGALELDIVARQGGLVAVVEVRSRAARGYESSLGSVSIAKRRRLLQATDRLWRGALVADRTVDRVRIDVAAVTFDAGETRVEYIPGAVVGE